MRRDNKHIYDTSEVLAKMATQGAFTMNSTELGRCCIAPKLGVIKTRTAGATVV